MRLDKYLKVSRLIKRRTIAKEICDGGKVKINGRAAKASSEVKAGDRLEIGLDKGRSWQRFWRLEKLCAPMRRKICISF